MCECLDANIHGNSKIICCFKNIYGLNFDFKNLLLNKITFKFF